MQHLGEPQAAVPFAERHRQLGAEQRFLPLHDHRVEVARYVHLVQRRQLHVQKRRKRDRVEQPEEQRQAMRVEREGRRPPDHAHSDRMQGCDPDPHPRDAGQGHDSGGRQVGEHQVVHRKRSAAAHLRLGPELIDHL